MATGGDVPKIAFEKYTLPNGLQVILHVDHKLPMVHVNNWYHVGSKNERLGRTGFAHLFEHMMFEGSKMPMPSTSPLSKRREPISLKAALTEPRAKIAPTTSNPCPPAVSNTFFGSNPIAWRR